MTAAERWAEDLAAWAIPEDILAAAPESPFGFPVAIFARAADAPLADTASVRRARERLQVRGSVLDVGCGAGAAAFGCLPLATEVTGVDESASMLEAFSARARERHVPFRAVEGRWPDVASEVSQADVVVCHHVLYNVADIGPFLDALHNHARRRVVVEITERHPLHWMNPLWLALHGIDRPEGPTAWDAASVLSGLGIDAQLERSVATSRLPDDLGALVAMTRRRLCVGGDRDDDLREALWRHPPPTERTLVTLWWDR